MSFGAFHPFRVFEPFRVPLGGELSPKEPPEGPPEIAFVTADGDLFFTSNNEQLVVQPET